MHYWLGFLDTKDLPKAYSRGYVVIKWKEHWTLYQKMWVFNYKGGHWLDVSMILVGLCNSRTISKVFPFLNRNYFPILYNFSSFLDLEKFKNSFVHVESQIPELALFYMGFKSKWKIITQDTHLKVVSMQILFKAMEIDNIKRMWS